MFLSFAIRVHAIETDPVVYD